MLARTLKPGPRYLLMVRALAGDSTMTRFCVAPPPSGRAAAAVLRGFRAAAGRAAARAGAAFLRVALAGGAAPSAGCFLRAGTGGLSLGVAVVFSCKPTTITIL